MIILAIVAFVGYIIYSLTTAHGSNTECSKQNIKGTCPAGEQCDATTGTCKSVGSDQCKDDADCNNNGKCQGDEGFKVCVCDQPYLGETNCKTVCSREGNQCKNGGTCSAIGTCICPKNYTGLVCQTEITDTTCRDYCKLPGCDAQKCLTLGPDKACNDGFATDDSKLPELCTTCAENRGPGNGNCSKKLYDWTKSGVQIGLGTDWYQGGCTGTGTTKDSTMDNECKTHLNSSRAVWSKKACDQACDENGERITCNYWGKAYVDNDVDMSKYNPCPHCVDDKACPTSAIIPKGWQPI